MTCLKGPVGIICVDPLYRIRDKKGKVWIFEYHFFCGPTVLRKDLEPFKRFPGEKSPFWDALEKWLDGGQKVEEKDGAAWAVWTA